VSPLPRRRRNAPSAAPPAARRGEAGYNLVMLMVLVTALNILVAAALPTWTSLEQREREEELIFRGLQYAEAIRVFQSRFGRLPVRLEELVEVEPRAIRQLWPDPMTGEVDWGLVFATGGGQTQRGDPNTGGRELGGGSGLTPSRDSDRPGGGGEIVSQGPIVGVYSRAEGDAFKTFNGKDTYSEWQFTVDLLSQRLGGGGQVPQPPPGGQPQDANGRPTPVPGGQGQQLGGLIQPGGGPPDLSSRWIGRAWPPAIQEQLGAGAAAAGSGPGGPGVIGQPGGAGQQGDPTVGGATDPRRRE
jgi:type II secretory pathway pseudopilin PulG